MLLARRGEFDGQWGFLDDKLVADPTLPLVDKSYYDDAKRMAELREQDVQRLQAAVTLFRSVFDGQTEGWVDVLRFNDKLTVLRAHDGAWDIVWDDMRESPPPPERAATTAYVLPVLDQPEVLLGKQDLARRLYFRRNVWDERAHLAEQHFYDRGGDRGERRRTSDDEVRRLYLTDKDAMPPNTHPLWEDPPPPGFRVVQIGEARRLVSDLVTVDEFRRMFDDGGYLERRDDGNDDWERANAGAAADQVAGATWNDAQALWPSRAGPSLRHRSSTRRGDRRPRQRWPRRPAGPRATVVWSWSDLPAVQRQRRDRLVLIDARRAHVQHRMEAAAPAQVAPPLPPGFGKTRAPTQRSRLQRHQPASLDLGQHLAEMLLLKAPAVLLLRAGASLLAAPAGGVALAGLRIFEVRQRKDVEPQLAAPIAGKGGIFDSVAYLKMEYKSLIKDVFQVRFVLWKYRLERGIVQTLHQNLSEHIAIIGRDG